MRNGRKTKRQSKKREINLNDVSLIMGRIVGTKDGKDSVMRFTWTYVDVLEVTEDKVLMEAPEVGIKKWLNIKNENLEEGNINGLIIERKEDSILLMSFSTLALEDVVDAMASAVMLVIKEGLREEQNKLLNGVDETLKKIGGMPS